MTVVAILSGIALVAALIGLAWPVRRGVVREVLFWAVALFFWWFGSFLAFVAIAGVHVLRLYLARARVRA